MTITLCTLNVNGIRAAQKRGFLRWLKRERPSILCLQEVRATRTEVAPELYSPAGYNARWLCAEKKGYSGVAIWSEDAADCYRVGSGLDWSDREGRVLSADFGELRIVSLYLPSGSSSPERQARKYVFMDHILEYTRELLDSGRPVALSGDFNIAHTELDIHAPKRNEKNSGFLPEERAWFSRLLEQGWTDLVRAKHPGRPGLYSWWSNRGRAREKDLGWRLDYILASPSLAPRIKDAFIDPRANLADHAPVWVEIDS